MKIYCIGGLGGKFPSEWVGKEQTLFQIYEGNSDRQWLEVDYISDKIKPIGNVRVIIPEGPDHPNALLDACLVFYPDYFINCPSLAAVKLQLRNAKRLDFHLGKERIPSEWNALREEARFLFSRLDIHEVKISKKDRFSNLLKSELTIHF